MLHAPIGRGSQTALDLPLPPTVALGVLGLGLFVLVVIGYDAYREVAT